MVPAIVFGYKLREVYQTGKLEARKKTIDERTEAPPTETTVILFFIIKPRITVNAKQK